jgi:hypothetical protein
MANLSTFPARANVEATDQFVGYRTATSGGEGRWTAATLQAWVQAFTTKSSIGLGSVDNTADSAKPVSTAQAAAISAAQAAAIASASADATTKANAAQSAAISTAASDATTKANAAQSAAASDATTKANAAQSAAISTAASDATTKANAAQSAAISTAASDATTKANAAQSAAISTAASDATTKANAAQAAAIASAASDATTKANAAQAAAIAASQPLDADLTAIAALTTTSFGRTFLTLADAAATRSALGLVIDSNVQSYSARLAAIAGLSTAADTLPYFTGASTAALATFTSTGRTLVAAADAAAGRSALGLVIGTHVQAYSSALATYAAIPPSANVQGFLAAADYAAMRTALGAGAASGLSTLDAGGKIPTAQIPDAVLGQVKFQGTWNAATNTPTLSGTPAATTKGDYYIVSTGGTQFSKTFEVGDWIISNGATQDKIDNTDAVTTVAGRIGNVTLTAADLTDGTAAGRTLFTAANAAAQRTALALVVGTDVQAYSANLAALAGITSAADRLPYFTGSGTATYANFTSYGRTLAALVDAAAGRTALGLATMATQAASAVAITGGAINGTTIGATTPNTAVFTSLTVNDNTTLGSSNSDTVNFNARVASDLNPSTDNTYDLGVTGHEWRNLNIDGTANIDSLVADTADITGGAINGTPIGATTPAAGSFTTLSASGTTGQNIFVALGTDNNGDALAQIKSTGSTGSSQLGFSDTAAVSGRLLYRHADDSLAIETGGAERARFNSTGVAVAGVSSATSTAGGAGFSIVRTGGSPSTFTMLNSGGEIIHEYNAVGYGFNVSTARIASISSTGLAVTGVISATGNVTLGASADGFYVTKPTSYFVHDTATAGNVYYGSVSSNTPVSVLVNNSVKGVFSSTGLAVTGTLTTSSTTLHTSSVSLTNGAAAATGTLTNAPTAGNPTKWIPIVDNGTTRYIPAW